MTKPKPHKDKPSKREEPLRAEMSFDGFVRRIARVKPEEIKAKKS